MQNFTFTTSKSIVCESGGLQRIAEICASAGIRRPLLVSDRGIADLGLLDRVAGLLREAGMHAAVFAGVVADPPEATVLAALESATAAQVDGVVGVGGGSSLDTAKLVALLAGSGQALAEVYGVEVASGPRLPLVLVPTTAGTGSEVTAVAIVTTGETTKTGVVSSHLYPDVALLDAELTLGLPPAITAMTGVDAMVHAVEAYTSALRKNPYSDLLAREALRLLGGSIRTAVANGADLAARQAMLLGACLAGQAFANAPVAAVHALAYPLGGQYHIPHGLSNSLVLPEVLRFNSAAAQTDYAELAAILVPEQDLAATEQGRAAQLEAYFRALIADLGLPATLSAAGVPAADLPLLAAEAMQQQRLLVNNPRTVAESDALAIYRAAYH
ncbi:iron-containing alcohol dehydrogenase [Mangrovimicrobium sediminis]|uniref:Iron-containing alcohol dehydrogenase n=1 Tax=Mangrovimicrobium sediminis TaxID=2562682 RepID=A0A4Z0M471_9GAMM|nr:iron-containing alcohol dehydrogenase [Haliea sp. SAOS-164]TGD74309.1 iron-containing alcohol dehydrogenase [Haliea sp. SAOS-164]